MSLLAHGHSMDPSHFKSTGKIFRQSQIYLQRLSSEAIAQKLGGSAIFDRESFILEPRKCAKNAQRRE